jgi:hypothetical protein
LNDDQYDVDYSSTDDDSDDDQNYTDDEPEKLLDRELEWDTSALEINAENKLNPSGTCLNRITNV